MDKKATIEKIISLTPNSIDELFNIFPWQLYDQSFNLPPDEEIMTIIAQKVSIETGAEVKNLILAEEVTIAEDAEIHGTIIARNVKCGKNSEINYLIAESVELDTDCEVKYAVIQNVIKMEEGSEILEIDANHAIEADLSQEASISVVNKIEQDNWDELIPPRINVILSSLLATL